MRRGHFAVGNKNRKSFHVFLNFFRLTNSVKIVMIIL